MASVHHNYQDSCFCPGWIGEGAIAACPPGYAHVTSTVVSSVKTMQIIYVENACLFYCNLPVNLLFKMNKMQCTADTDANFLSKANSRGERIFVKTLFPMFKVVVVQIYSRDAESMKSKQAKQNTHSQTY